jgi:hypothetical protein
VYGDVEEHEKKREEHHINRGLLTHLHFKKETTKSFVFPEGIGLEVTNRPPTREQVLRRCDRAVVSLGKHIALEKNIENWT